MFSFLGLLTLVRLTLNDSMKQKETTPGKPGNTKKQEISQNDTKKKER